METLVICDERHYEKALKRVDEIFNANADTIEGLELKELLLAIKNYEDIHHKVEKP